MTPDQEHRNALLLHLYRHASEEWLLLCEIHGISGNATNAAQVSIARKLADLHLAELKFGEHVQDTRIRITCTGVGVVEGSINWTGKAQ